VATRSSVYIRRVNIPKSRDGNAPDDGDGLLLPGLRVPFSETVSVHNSRREENMK
jgi:hypothetical protein